MQHIPILHAGVSSAQVMRWNEKLPESSMLKRRKPISLFAIFVLVKNTSGYHVKTLTYFFKCALQTGFALADFDSLFTFVLNFGLHLKEN